MSLHGKLTAVLCVLVLALGVAACGGGGSSRPDPAAQQRSVVDTAIEKAGDAILGLLGLNADATDAHLKAAADAVAAAKKAVADASALSDDDKKKLDEKISDLEGSLDRTRKIIVDARKTREQTIREEARKLTAALSGARITGIVATPRHEAAPVMSGTVPGTPAVSVSDLETTAAGGASVVDVWKRGLYTASDDGTEDTVVLYTNIKPPGSRPFSGEGGKYGTANGLDAEGNLRIVGATDTTLIVSSGFPTGPGIRDHPPGAGGTVLVAGSFDGAPGTFVCTPTASLACTSSVKDGGGYVLSGGGGWKFVPAEGARVPEPDAEYQYFGWWLREAGDVHAVGVFHGGEGGATDEFANLAALQGRATYRGPAAGKFAILPPSGEADAEAGDFTATATLRVDFGDGTTPGTVTGEVGNFMVGGETKDWSVELGSAAVGTHGAISSGGTDTALTHWTIADEKAETTGTWNGRFHDADMDRTPLVATGRFDAVHGAIGRMTGAFGTTRQPQ